MSMEEFAGHVHGDTHCPECYRVEGRPVDSWPKHCACGGLIHGHLHGFQTAWGTGEQVAPIHQMCDRCGTDYHEAEEGAAPGTTAA